MLMFKNRINEILKIIRGEKLDEFLIENSWNEIYEELELTGAYYSFASGIEDGITIGEATYKDILKDTKTLINKGYNIDLEKDEDNIEEQFFNLLNELLINKCENKISTLD